MSGPRTPRPPVPWQSAQRRRQPPMPAWTAPGLPARAFLDRRVWADGAANASSQETTTAENNGHVMAGILPPPRSGGKETLPPKRRSEREAWLLLFGLVGVCRLAEEQLGRLHQRLGQC